jgi:hypothetical protein
VEPWRMVLAPGMWGRREGEKKEYDAWAPQVVVCMGYEI